MRRAYRLAALLLVAALVAACGAPAPQPTPTRAPTPVPGRPGAALPEPPPAAPALIARSPARGEVLDPGGALVLTFDRPMDQAATAGALQVGPNVAGRVEWADARTLRFVPAAPLQRAASYDVTIGDAARAADGQRLEAPLSFRFATAGFLEVGQVIPADGAADVQPEATITVLFSRPVVPLVAVAQQQGLPQPLSFDPPLAGRGEWLSTAVYTFTPDAPLAGGTTYTGRVAAGLVAADGSPLQSEYTWRFTTARPQVVTIDPPDGQQLVPVEPTIRLTFNVPIDAAAARSAFRLSGPGGDVPGDLQVDGATLTFTPTQRLAFGADHTVAVAASLTGVSGGLGMAGDFRATFRSVPLPRVLRTEPADGAQRVPPGSGFVISFSAPVDPATVMDNVTIIPDPGEVYTYANEFDPSFYIGLNARPSTDYEVRIGPDIADRYGNRTGQSLTVRFRTDPLPPSIRLLTPGFLGTYAAGRPARVAILATNVAQAPLELYRLPVERLIDGQLTDSNGGPPADATLLRRWQAPLSVPTDTPTIVRVGLAEGDAPLDPGPYLLLADSPDGSRQPHVLLVSALNLTLKSAERDVLVWASDLASAAPAPGLNLELYDDTGAQLGGATTGPDGVGQLQLSRTENRRLLALSRQPFAAFASGWGLDGGPWDFGLEATYDLPELAAYVYTDRPIYRPGQQVHFKGVLRAEDDAAYSLPGGLSGQVLIRSAAGEQVHQQPLSLSPGGTFDGSFTLPTGAATGTYDISVEAGGRSWSFPFQVAAYRAPEFEVTVAPRQAELVRGTPSEAVATARYFFGAPAADLPVQWNVLAEPYVLAPDWAGRYRFGESGDPWSCWVCWWEPSPPPQPILSGSATSDARGQVTISLPPELRDPQGNVISGSVRLTVEASATGRDSQVISGRAQTIVHAGELYVGLAAQRYVGRAGESQAVDVVTVDTQGRRLGGQAVELEFVKTTWDSVFVEDGQGGGRWESREVLTPVATQSLTTDAQGAAVASFTPADGGAYRVRARARDAGGREVRSSLYVWVVGSGYTPWLRDDSARISLIADRSIYRPGETATVLVPSPFTQPHWALISVERGGILSYEVRRVTGNSIVYDLPISAQHAPNIFVTVTLVSPPDEPGGPADYKIGILPLAVEPSAQTLNVSVTPAAPRFGPGEQATFEVQVTDAGGAPAAAELSIDLVDRAVLTLQPRAPNAIREALYARRGLGVFTTSGLSVSSERYQQQLDEQEKGSGQPGGGAATDAVAQSGMPAPTTMPAAAAAPEMARADDGLAAPPGVTVREQFADTAYWSAMVATDASGRASVTIPLPDNLTTWVLRGVALDAATRVGEGTGEVLATKPLLVRPVTPRFFTVGDTAELSANISNTTDGPLDAQVALAASGLTITTPVTQTVSVPAGGEVGVSWTVTAADVEAADLVFSVVSGQYSDAARPRLATAPAGQIPVYRYSAPETVGTGGQLEAAGARTEVVGLPPELDTRQGELAVRLDPSLAAGILAGLEALEDEEYDTVELTVSRFLPNVLAVRALRRLNIARPELEARLPQLVGDALDQLYLWQNGDGGWGWWSAQESNAYVSAYVVFGMLRAREAGQSVRDDVLARGLDYLATQLADDARVRETHEANRQAWLLYVLADGGRPDRGRVDALYGNRERLGVYGKALLALAMSRADAGDGRIKTLLSDLNSAAIASATGFHWEEQARDYWSMGGDTRTTAIALAALVQLDPQNQLIPSAVRWLMVARRGGGWETAQESAWAMIALTDWMERTAEQRGEYDYAVWLNGAERAAGRVTPTSVLSPTLLTIPVGELSRDVGSALAVARGDGPGRLYYTAHLNVFLPADSVPALDRGLAVTRRYVAADCDDGPRCPELSEVRLGETVRVELSVVAPRDMYYLQLEDPLPAGGEAIDPALATTSLLEREPGLSPDGGPVPLRGVTFEGYSPWRWRWYSRVELRDEKVALFADYLPRGSYLFSYTFRTTLPGEYRVIPAVARESFFPEVFGRSEGRLLRITR